MKIYKKEFKDQIYELNYDELVTHPTEEIKSLILCLGGNGMIYIYRHI